MFLIKDRTKSWISILMNSSFLSWIFLGNPDITHFYIMMNILCFYCLVDMKNSKDMILHHIAVLGIGFSLNNFTSLDIVAPEIKEAFLSYNKVFFKTEVSTIFLSLIHLKYKNPIVYGLFFSTFVYFRNYNLTKTFLDWEINIFTETFCRNSFCVYVWYISYLTLIGLNWYWLCFILTKLKKMIIRKIK